MNNITIFTAGYILLLWQAYKVITFEELTTKKRKRINTIIFAGVVSAVTLLKVWLSGSFFGHSSDMSLFSAWADLGANERLSDFYSFKGKDVFVDYPPLYLYVLTIVGKFARLFNVSYGSVPYTVFIKFIPILSDTFTALLVFWLAKRECGEKCAGVLSFLVLLNPAYILNSTFWGQIDGLYTLIIFWLIFSLYKKRYVDVPIAFTVGILIKPQMIIFLPLMGFWTLFDVIAELKEEKSTRSLMFFLKGTGTALVVTLIIVFPMFGFDFSKFIRLYTDAANQYPYASLNAANIFSAFGKNWASVTETFLGISYQSWGFIGIILTSLAVGLGAFFTQKREGVLILGAFNTLSIFMLAHTMHERYMFPLILLIMVVYIYTKDKRMFFGFGASTILCFIQTGVILLDNEGIINLSQASLIALSWVHIVFYIYMIVVWFKMLILDEIKFSKTHGTKIVCIEPNEKKAEYTRKDIVIIGVLTAVYAFFAFFNLGSLNAPETSYAPDTNGETVIIDLGDERKVERLNLFIGWMDRRERDAEVQRELKISFGIMADEETKEFVFGDETTIFADSVFRWTGFFARETGRYIKISSDEKNFNINEIAVFDENKNQITPIGVLSENETAQKLIDEQNTAVFEYSWYDGTYFDEIYHPRTAYEYLEGLTPYENTHPPLGKLFISLGMMIFGVNPFGWRFFGTLCGVLMVPAVYVFSKELLKKTKWATICAFLFTFDFMHLTQTRLATIDSYVVFFVILMYLFMHRYIKMNFYNTGVRKTLMPLFLSGLFFGICVSVKWQGAYAGAGLCVMFFVSLYKRYKEFCAAKDERLVGDGEKIIKNFGKSTVKTLIFAFLFFVVVPFIIYFLSYLPIILSENADISYFWENQKSMLSYHSNLTETHPYGSPWWSWAIDLRPLYAYNPNWDFVPHGIAQGISSFGNPLVWWLTVPSMGYLIYLLRHKPSQEISTVLTGFGAMYLPWILITRQAFIYHFFPCVPFVAIAISYCIRELLAKFPKAKIPIRVYLILVFVLFVAFYPVLTGLKIPESYARLLTWLPSWVLG